MMENDGLSRQRSWRGAKENNYVESDNRPSAAINVLRDSAESRRMPSGEPLDEDSVQLHLDAAGTLEYALSDLRDHE
ncbi:hypothetical protein ACLKMY_21190 [Paraburkholderia mimosarum]|uniref:hypothetical protein n=1 Tax=Paraburkholderia mimosarum TaxID=312026 RepID=UPI0039C442D9